MSELKVKSTEKESTKKQRTWSVRAYREGDEDRMLELWRAVHPERRNLEQPWLRWRQWMFREIPAGSGTWLADDNGKIAGQQSFTLMNLKIGKDIVKAGTSVNLATHPDYRHQGIMTALLTKALTDLDAAGVHVTIGFPNSQSLPGGIKMGFSHVGAAGKMVRVFKWDGILKAKFHNKILLKLGTVSGSLLNVFLFHASRAPTIKGLTVTQVTRFDERIDEFWTRISDHFPIIIARSKDYLNWRYCSVPGVNYSIYAAERDGKVQGYLVLRYFQEGDKKSALIYDLLAETTEVARCLLATVSEQCRRDAVDYVTWVGISSKAHRKVFQKAGFLYNPRGKGWNLRAYSTTPSISKAFLANPDNWLVQTGDSDIL